MLSGLNLILQLCLTTALIVGIASVKRLKFSAHGYLMFIVVALNLPSIAIVMLPSASRILAGASANLFTAIVAAHSLLGVIAIGAGIYVMWIWRFRKPGVSCFRSRGLMRALAPMWMVTVVLGVAMYYMLYS
jgi:uncharacterized membrane protein YozB (DUF420 family)